MRLALALVVFSGCALGAGTSTVGIWKPKHVVDTDVCIQDRPDHCGQTVEVGADYPARSFGGGLFSAFNPGIMHVSGVPGVTNLFALENHIEYLRGRGAMALGLRIGGDFGIGLHHIIIDTPINLVGHIGDENWSLYAGPGYTPYFDAGDNQTHVDETHQGFNVLAGGRILLRESRSIRWTASAEVFQTFLTGGVLTTSATVGIGLHL